MIRSLFQTAQLPVTQPGPLVTSMQIVRHANAIVETSPYYENI